MIELRNHTPHPIEIRLDDRAAVVLRPEPPLPRLMADRREAGALETLWGPIPLTVTAPTGVVTDLPDPRPGVCLIVARAVADALPERTDLLYPDDVVRDGEGRVIACRALGSPETS